MSGKCLSPQDLRKAWKGDRPLVEPHLQGCDRCRQVLLVSAGLASLQVRQKPPSASFHLWRKRLQDRVAEVGRVTLPISVMYYLSVVVLLAFLMLALDGSNSTVSKEIIQTVQDWGTRIEWATYVGGTLVLAFIMARILRPEEE